MFLKQVSLHSVWDLTAMQVKNSASPNKMPLCQPISLQFFLYLQTMYSFIFYLFLNSYIISLFWVCLEWSRSQKWSWEYQQKNTQHNYLLK
jgi:hypothetical protein